MGDLGRLRPFNNIYHGKKVLITGISGFKGSWLSQWLEILGADVHGFGLVPDTNPAHINLLKKDFSIININDQNSLESYLESVNPDIIFHLAAQSLVRKSYMEPKNTYETNVIGALNLYQGSKDLRDLKGIVSITSDKVYENKEQYTPYVETDQLGGFDMYSSSKSCVEILSSSFFRSFGKEISFPIVTARAGNVIGGGDWAEDRLMPDLYRSIEERNTMKVRNPKSVRPWQHVLEPLSGYLRIGQLMLESKLPVVFDSWNFGPSNSEAFSVEDVLVLAKDSWGKVRFELNRDTNDMHEAGLLLVDSQKAKSDFDWEPVWSVSKAVQSTIEWYKSFYESGSINTNDDISAYMDNARDTINAWIK